MRYLLPILATGLAACSAEAPQARLSSLPPTIQYSVLAFGDGAGGFIDIDGTVLPVGQRARGGETFALSKYLASSSGWSADYAAAQRLAVATTGEDERATRQLRAALLLLDGDLPAPDEASPQELAQIAAQAAVLAEDGAPEPVAFERALPYLERTWDENQINAAAASVARATRAAVSRHWKSEHDNAIRQSNPSVYAGIEAYKSRLEQAASELARRSESQS